LSQTGRRALRHLLRSHGLELTALGCPLRHGLATPEGQEARIEHVQQVLALSYDLGPRIVIVQAGRVPLEGSPSPGMEEVLRVLGRYGDQVGARLALETGLEAGSVLAPFLDRFDTGGLGVNLNPANLIVGGFDPPEDTRALGTHIIHAYATDARRAAANQAARQVPLGHGDVDWLTLLGALEEVAYRGWLTIEQESATDPLADMKAGVAFLRRLGVANID